MTFMAWAYSRVGVSRDPLTISAATATMVVCDHWKQVQPGVPFKGRIPKVGKLSSRLSLQNRNGNRMKE